MLVFSALRLFPFTQRKEPGAWQQLRGAASLRVVWEEKGNRAAAGVERLGAETFAEVVGQKLRGSCTDSEQLLFFSGRLTGNWTIQTGQGGFVSPPKAKPRT